MNDLRMRLTVVGGFLGSGKTTWLRHQLFENRFGRVHVIVNEAAGTPIDDALLNVGLDVSVLAGGCACCDGADRFQAELLRLCDLRSQTSSTQRRVDEIVLETSGLADPAAIVRLIHSHPVLCRQIVVTEVIVIVDALNAPALLAGNDLAQDQIAAADRLIFTKTDAVGAETARRLRKTLQSYAPAALLSAASFGTEVSLPEVLPHTEAFSIAPASTGGSDQITTAQLDLGNTPDWTALTL